jgi:hypothetical protein
MVSCRGAVKTACCVALELFSPTSEGSLSFPDRQGGDAGMTSTRRTRAALPMFD